MDGFTSVSRLFGRAIGSDSAAWLREIDEASLDDVIEATASIEGEGKEAFAAELAIRDLQIS